MYTFSETNAYSLLSLIKTYFDIYLIDYLLKLLHLSDFTENYMGSKLLTQVISCIFLIAMILTTALGFSEGRTQFEKQTFTNITRVDLISATKSEGLFTGRQKNYQAITPQTSLSQETQPKNHTSQLGENDEIDPISASRKLPTILRGKDKKISKRNLYISKTILLETLGKSNISIDDALKMLDNEFGILVDRVDLNLSWWKNLFTSDAEILLLKHRDICYGNAYDVIDSYDDISIEGIPFEWKNQIESHLGFKNDLDEELKSMSRKERINYFIRKTVWCGNKIDSNDNSKRCNDKLMEALIDIYEGIKREEAALLKLKKFYWKLLEKGEPVPTTEE